MTKKDDLQAELLAKVKLGTKPSHLKRSKSADDINPPKPPPLPSSELEQLKKENEQLKQEQQTTQARLKELHDFAKSDNTSTNPTPAPSQLTSELKKQTDLNTLLSEQLKEKQQQIETLRQKDEDSAKQIEELKEQRELQSRFNSLREPELNELDQALFARHQSLKD